MSEATYITPLCVILLQLLGLSLDSQLVSREVLGVDGRIVPPCVHSDQLVWTKYYYFYYYKICIAHKFKHARVGGAQYHSSRTMYSSIMVDRVKVSCLTQHKNKRVWRSSSQPITWLGAKALNMTQLMQTCIHKPKYTVNTK